MSKIQFEIFKTPDDYQNWNKHIEFSIRTDEYDEDFKIELYNAFNFLKHELGKSFLRHETKKIHPFKNYLANRIKESFLWIIWFSKTLKHFKDKDCNYGELKNKVLGVNSFETEGLPFIEIASKFIPNNFDFLFEPYNKNGKKNPDIRVIDIENHQKFYIEITKLNNSQLRLSHSKNYHSIFRELSKAPIKTYFSGKILNPFNEKRLNEIIEDLKSIKEKVSRNELIEYYSNKEVDIAISHISKEDTLREWSTERNYPLFDIQPIAIDFNEIDRIINNKLVDKAKQIPSKNYGIICIAIDSLFFYVDNSKTSIQKIEKKLNQSEFYNVLGIYIYSRIGRRTETVINSYKKHIYGRKKTCNNYCEDFQFIINKNCLNKMSQNTLNKIYTAFSI
ncbi:hypothetical protein [Winogradskyella algicola]|uniref:hypothetical protein n=1 Tax=Winogradskyella algicola TaxID=2575815 RepID=UPI001108A67F|nr:hypothetical protein [Winogradskyella algicola]